MAIIDEHKCVHVGADDPFVAKCQRQLEKRYAPIRSVIKAESGDLPDQAQRLLDKILHDYKDSSLSEKTVANPHMVTVPSISSTTRQRSSVHFV